MFFSIIIPVYNGESTIITTVNSILSQTFQDFEILIINDGSNDNTLSLLNTLKDARIQIINITNSGGPAKPRNIGIHLAKGNYICFIDADDTWFSNKLEHCLKILNNKPFDVLYHQLLNTSNNQILQTRILNYTNPYNDLLLNGNAISLSGSIVSLKFIIKNNIKFNESKKFKIVEDYNFWLECASHNAEFYNVKDVLGKYNYNANSISFNIKEYYYNLMHCLNYNLNKRNLNILFIYYIKSYHKFNFIKSNFIQNKFVPKFLIFNLFNPLFIYFLILLIFKKLFKWMI